MAQTPKFVQVETDAIITDLVTFLRDDLIKKQRKLDQIQRLITNARSYYSEYIDIYTLEAVLEDDR